MAKSYCLNPFASTFVPSFLPEAESIAAKSEPLSAEANSIKSVALHFIQRVIEIKRERGEATLTKPELVNLVQKLICLRYKITGRQEITWIRAYLSDKIPDIVPLSLKRNGESSMVSSGIHPRTFDFSVYRLPTPTILLVSFFGMYRHEKAFRPLLSLPHRPEAFQDVVWSVTERDLKLWNRFVVQPCSCPPMFGYSIPVEFFGNPFKFNHTCSMTEIHLSRSEDTEEGNEIILQEAYQSCEISEAGFVDFEEKLTARADLEYYSQKLKEIVSSVYKLIDDLETMDVEDGVDEGFSSNDTFVDMLWNKEVSDLNNLEADNNHQLLDVEFDEPELEDVPLEIKELLRRSLSCESNLETPCDPPCSEWCSELENFNSAPTSKPDATAIDLLNETTEFVTGISSKSETPIKPTFRRSFSANDCDPSYDWKFGATSRLSSRSKFGKRESWRDSDSGIMTQWSSQEDVFGEDESETGEKAPMWTLFSGEDSLWKPLPASEQAKLAPHKRVRDLRRQTSSVN